MPPEGSQSARSVPGRSIAIVTDDPGWHGARLRSAFLARGAQVSWVSLAQCRIDLDTAGGVVVAGFEAGLPDAVFVRGIAAGSLEQVILRLDVLHALRELGVPVYNDARAIERSVDKAMTSFLLHRAAIPTPPTWALEDEPRARALLEREYAAGHEVVVKPLFGSQGRGLVRLSPAQALPDGIAQGGVWYLQRFVRTAGGSFHDWRVLVIGGRAMAAMIRHGTTWINNVAQGARCEPCVLDADLARLAEAATAAIGMDYAGVDLIRDDEGRLQVLEVNSIPAWRGLQTVAPIDIAARLADDLLQRRVQRAGTAA